MVPQEPRSELVLALAREAVLAEERQRPALVALGQVLVPVPVWVRLLVQEPVLQ